MYLLGFESNLSARKLNPGGYLPSTEFANNAGGYFEQSSITLFMSSLSKISCIASSKIFSRSDSPSLFSTPSCILVYRV
jgi:hypothetical protein